jgi:uncharacterized membrane protein YfhO
VVEREALLGRLNDSAFDPASSVLLEQDPACELAEATQSGDVRFTRQGNNRIQVDVQADAGGLLVLSENFYPGWRATVDGKPVPLLRANYVLRAVCVPAGAHRVTFSFVPASLRIGAGLTLLSLILVGWAGLRQIRTRR